MSITIRTSVKLGARFRNICLNDALAVYALDELVKSASQDLIGDYPGEYQGNVDRGVSVPLPEGALGIGLAGSGYVRVPYTTGLNLGGTSYTVSILFRTSHISSTSRYVLHSGSTINGWEVRLNQQLIRVRAYRGSAVIYTLTTGAVSDSAWHSLVIAYDTAGNRARVYLDGVEEDSAAATQDLLDSTADVFIGAKDAAAALSGDGFIGQVAYCCLKTSYDVEFPTDLEGARKWTDISEDVADVSPVAIVKGIQSPSPFVRIAGASTCTLHLDNSDLNSAKTLGYYTLEHPQQRPGWGLNIPLKVEVYEDVSNIWKTRFRGEIQDVLPTSGIYADRKATVLAASWFHYAGRFAAGTVPTQLNVNSSQAFARLVDQSRTPPPAINFSIGDITFAFALDKVLPETALLSALADVQRSESGYGYEKADGTLRFESATERYLSSTVDDTFDGSAVKLDAGVKSDQIRNRIRYTYSYREIGPVDSVLFSMQRRVEILAGSTITLSLRYRDPNEKATDVGATGIVKPVALTDFTFNSLEDGTGDDRTNDIELVAFEDSLGGNQSELRITNTGTLSGWFLLSQLRGTPLFTYDRPAFIMENIGSIHRYGLHEWSQQLKYLSDGKELQSLAQRALLLFGIPISSISLTTFFRDEPTSLLDIDVGSVIGVGETVTASEPRVRRFVNGVSERMWPWAIETSLILTNSLPTAFWVVGVPGRSEVGQTTYVL